MESRVWLLAAALLSISGAPGCRKSPTVRDPPQPEEVSWPKHVAPRPRVAPASPDFARLDPLAFSPDGTATLLEGEAAARAEVVLWQVEPPEAAPRWRVPLAGAHPEGTFSPKGDRVAIATDQELVVIDVASGAVKERTPLGAGGAVRWAKAKPEVVPRGAPPRTAAEGGGTRVIEDRWAHMRVEVDGKVVADRAASAASVAPDGQRILLRLANEATSGEPVPSGLQPRVLLDAAGKELATLPPREGVVFSPDAQRIYARDEDGHVEVRNREGKVLRTLRVAPGVEGIVASPDGARLAVSAPGGFVVLEAETGRTRGSFGWHATPLAAEATACNPESDQVAWLAPGLGLLTVDLARRSVRRLGLSGVGTEGTRISWGAGQPITVVLPRRADGHRRARAFQPDGREVELSPRALLEGGRALALHGTHLVQTKWFCGSGGGCDPGEWVMTDLVTGAALARGVFTEACAPQEGCGPAALAFSPSGERLAQATNRQLDAFTSRTPDAAVLHGRALSCETPVAPLFAGEEQLLFRCGRRLDVMTLAEDGPWRAFLLPTSSGPEAASAEAGLFVAQGRVAELATGKHRADVAAPLCFGRGGRTLLDAAGLVRLADGSRVYLFVVRTSAGYELVATTPDGKIEASDTALAEIPWQDGDRRLGAADLASRRAKGLVAALLR